MKLKQLTAAEEQTMQILWKLKEAVVKDIIAEMDKPKPAYSTISTVIRVLEKKEFVGHKAYGNTHLYFPLVSEESYRAFSFNKIFTNYFDKSYSNLFSFLVEENRLSEKEKKEIEDILSKVKKK